MVKGDKGRGRVTRHARRDGASAPGKPLCETHGVQGFPTIKYGDVGRLEIKLQEFSNGERERERERSMWINTSVNLLRSLSFSA